MVRDHATQLTMRQMYQWKIVCDRPNRIYATTELLDILWDSLTVEEQTQDLFLHKNSNRDGSKHSYGCTTADKLNLANSVVSIEKC